MSIEKLGREKCAELEYNAALSEIRARTEYNRRAIYFQILLCGIAAGAVAQLVLDTITPAAFDIAGTLLVIGNAALLIEINQNDFYIAKSSEYIYLILNEKYKDKDEFGFIPFEWEVFLSVVKRKEKSTLYVLDYLLEPSFVMCLLINIVFMSAMVMLHPSFLSIGVVAVNALFVVYAAARHYKSWKKFNGVVPAAARAAFCSRYDFPRES